MRAASIVAGVSIVIASLAGSDRRSEPHVDGAATAR